MRRNKPEIPAATGPGLVTREGAPVPLYGVAIEARVRDGAVLTTVSQRFRNTEKGPIEAVYSFPLEESSAVCGLEIELAGRVLKGMVEEREKAFEKYDEAMRDGNSAFLLDQFRPDIFLVSVGRLQPGEEAVVRITAVSRAESWDRGLRLRIPTTISPRYIPREQARTSDPADLEAILPPTVIGKVPYGLTLEVDIAAGGTIASVSCPSHPVEVSISGKKASVRLAGRDVQLDSDFVLNVELAKPSASRCIACRDGGGYALMIRMKPGVPDEKPGPRDVIFVVDRSGSMAGDSIAEARDALVLCLKSLREGDRFDVIGFGSRHERIFGKPVEYTDETVEKALAATSEWDADLGGTEILQPLTQALQDAGSERLTNIFLLTDGQVGNEADVIALASRHRSSARVFSFGIGRGASGSLVKGVAKASGGVAEFIYPGERIEPKVLRQMARLSSQVVLGSKMDWGSLRPTASTPSEAPAFAAGDELRFLCSVPDLSRTKVRLLARNGSPLAECEVEIDEEALEGDNAIALLLARGLIEDLEAVDAQAGSRQTSRKKKSTGSRILEIALKYQLASSQTSFIAVETRADASSADPVALRRVPVALTAGWGGIGSGTLVLASAMIPSPNAPFGAAQHAQGPAFLRKQVHEIRPMKSVKGFFAESCPTLSGPAVPKGDSLLALVSLQKADGSWILGKKLAALAGTSQDPILGAARGDLAKPAFAGTLVALFLLWTEHATRKDEWKLIAEKALGWLAGRGVVPALPSGGQALFDWLGSLDPKGAESHD